MGVVVCFWVVDAKRCSMHSSCFELWREEGRGLTVGVVWWWEVTGRVKGRVGRRTRQVSDFRRGGMGLGPAGAVQAARCFLWEMTRRGALVRAGSVPG